MLDTPKAVVIGFTLLAAALIYAANVVKPPDNYWFKDWEGSQFLRVNARTLDVDLCRITIGKRTVACGAMENSP